MPTAQTRAAERVWSRRAGTVGASRDDDGGSNAGAVYVLFQDTSGAVVGAQKISNSHGGLSSYYTLDAGDYFGISVAAIGDLNQDGVMDLAVGAYGDDDGGSGGAATSAAPPPIAGTEAEARIRAAPPSMSLRSTPRACSSVS